jgi:hypothetical protein
MKLNQEMGHVERYLNSVLIVLHNSMLCDAEFLITANLFEVHHISF